MARRDPQAVIDEMSDIQKMIHLAHRMDAFDIDHIKGNIARRRVAIYEEELTIQASQVGCSGRRGRLTNASIQADLSTRSQTDAESIVNTYNYDLAMAISAIFAEVPTANRHVYAHRLRDWEERRAGWKDKQVMQYTEGTARTRAQSDFQGRNQVRGRARLEPREAKCPVCIGWVKRGWVRVEEAMNNPGPWHNNCPHLWDIDPKQVPKDQCPTLWMGE